MSADAPRAVSALVDAGPEPLIIDQPEAGADAPWVIMIHALGENRTGNNYWQARAAESLADAGFTAVRFDLSGYGESLGAKDVSVWDDQVRSAVSFAAEQGATAVHVTARGLHCALLARLDVPGCRVALYPPRHAALGWWSRNASAREQAGFVEAAYQPDPDERAFWECCGAESNVVGGLRIPVSVLDTLIERVPTDGQSAWDLTVLAAGHDGGPRPARLVCGHDPLTRLETDRYGLEQALTRFLRGTRAIPARSA
jgi:pimeloyl-ACP methyl ester carboxylesterase